MNRKFPLYVKKARVHTTPLQYALYRRINLKLSFINDSSYERSKNCQEIRTRWCAIQLGSDLSSPEYPAAFTVVSRREHFLSSMIRNSGHQQQHPNVVDNNGFGSKSVFRQYLPGYAELVREVASVKV